MVRVRRPDDFMFGSGPSRRFVAEMAAGGIRANEIIPGGQCGVFGGPGYANMLGRWLTNGYHPMLISQAEVEGERVTEESFTP
jgi:hypothetical protein